MRLFSLISLALAAVSSVNAIAISNTTVIDDAVTAIHNLRSPPGSKGFIDIGRDGIARSYDSRGKVMDAVRLTTDQLHALANSYPNSKSRAQLREYWKKLNTNDDIAMWFPGDELKPSEFRTSSSDGQDGNLDLGFSRYRRSFDVHNLRRGDPVEDYCRERKCTSTDGCSFMGCGVCINLGLSSKTCV